MHYNGPNVFYDFPNVIYLLKVNSENTRTICEISKLPMNTADRCQWRRSGVFIVNFEQILLIVLVVPLLNLNKQTLDRTNVFAFDF